MNAGAVLLLASLLLAFAAQTAGLGPSHPARHGYFDQPFYSVHGGILGEAFYWAATSLFHRLGAQILAVLLFACGLLLITQTTLSTLLTRAGRMARTAGTGTRELAKTVRMSGGYGDFEPDGRDIAITRAGPTEPLATQALSDSELPDAETTRFGEEEPGWEDDEPESPGPGQFAYEDTAPDIPDRAEEEGEAARDEPAGELTPMGNRRWGITESDEIDYELPAPKVLERAKTDPGPDMRDREVTANALLEALRHFGIEARLLGVVSGPARHEGLQGRPPSRRPRLRAGLHRHPHPCPDPGQESSGCRGSEPAPPPRPTGRHLRRPSQGVLAAGRVAWQGRLRAGRVDRPGTDAARAGRRHDRLR